jgi:hypothetical protein
MRRRLLLLIALAPDDDVDDGLALGAPAFGAADPAALGAD